MFNVISFMPLLFQGLLALIIWEIYASFVSPKLLNIELRPQQLAKNLFNTQSDLVGNILHIGTGIIVYPLIWYFLSNSFPILQQLPWMMRSLFFGIFTWFMALGVFAPLAGARFMADWQDITWASLIGHIMYAIPLMFAK